MATLALESAHPRHRRRQRQDAAAEAPESVDDSVIATEA
jgi:hypothetical protein